VNHVRVLGHRKSSLECWIGSQNSGRAESDSRGNSGVELTIRHSEVAGNFCRYTFLNTHPTKTKSSSYGKFATTVLESCFILNEFIACARVKG
jgi:hypothetical protein